MLQGCVTAREIWSGVVAFWGKPDWIPTADTGILARWMEKRGVTRMSITLVFWCQWKHRNNVVFNNERPSVATVMQMIRTKFVAWKAAGYFRGELFSFPQPIPNWLLDGD